MRAPQRIWMTGICTRPIHALAAQIADSVTRSGGRLGDWQHDTGGERGALATWREHTELPGSVHVTVVLAVQAGGVRWGLCARLDRGWTGSHTSPARLVGLALPDQTCAGCSDRKRSAARSSRSPLPAAVNPSRSRTSTPWPRVIAVAMADWICR